MREGAWRWRCFRPRVPRKRTATVRSPKGVPVALAHSRYAEPHPWLWWPTPAAEPALFWARGTTGDSAIHAAFFDAAGRLSGETVISESAGYNTGARSAWSGAGAALVWKRRPAEAEFEVLFRRIADSLAPAPGGDVLVSSGARDRDRFGAFARGPDER